MWQVNANMAGVQETQFVGLSTGLMALQAPCRQAFGDILSPKLCWNQPFNRNLAADPLYD